jgi:uncharacterized protein with FMN-binding domain
MAKQASGKRGSGKVANSLVAVSSAAVLAVYAAGYTRTQSAADKLDGQGAERRPSMPRPPRTTSPVADFQIAAPAAAAVGVTPAAAADLPVNQKPALIASVEPAPAGTPSVKPVAAKVNPENSSAPTAAAVPATSSAPVAATAPAPVPAPAAPAVAAAPAAPAPDAAYKAIIAAAAPPWKDGSYEGWGTCRHGDLQATVVIEGGHITSATITQCLTRYSCDIIDKLPPQVIQRQSPEVSYVSGATQSTDAYYWAVVSALGKAK